MTLSTTLRTSGLPSRVFVWPSNSGCGTHTAMTALRPSRMCSPPRLPSASFSSFAFLACVLTARVSDVFKPSKCVPPSLVRMLLAYPSSVSVYASLVHCSAPSTWTPSTSARNVIGS